MISSRGSEESRSRGLSWIAVSVLGVLLLLVPLYDVWDDVTNYSWTLSQTLIENALLIGLALGLVYGGVWLGQQNWKAEYVWTVTKWNLSIAGAIAGLYAIVIGLQLIVLGALKPWVLALDGFLFVSVTAFGVGLYNARQQKTRDELERSREEYRTLTDDVLGTSEVATLVLDDDFRVAWANRAAADYFGLDREAILGADKHALVEDHIADAVEDSEQFRERVLATYRNNTSVEQFECHVTASGNRDERWLEHWSQPIENGLYAGGRIEHYTDITQRKRSEQELELREQALQEMYEAVSDTGTTYEEKVDELIGIGRELFGAEYGGLARIDEHDDYHIEVVQNDLYELDAGDVHPLAETYCSRTVEANRTIQFETEPTSEAGHTGDATDGFEMYVGTPVYERDTLYGTLCFLSRDQTEQFDDWELTMVELMGNWIGYELTRKRLLEEREQRLQEAEAKFEEVVDSVDNYAIFRLDRQGRIASWNRGAEEIKGYAESEIVGEHIEVFYPEEAVADGLPEYLLAEARETGQAHHEGWRVRKDGTRFWADVTIATRYDDDGKHAGYTKVVQDLTDQREYERTIEHERERLEFMNRILRHNILNGLNLVRARSKVIESAVDGEETEQHLETIQNRVDDLTSLVQTMRSFMDAIVSDADHETEPVALRPALEEKVSLAAESYPDAEFETHDLPPESTEIVADELVGEVFENVLSNAVVHNDKETPEVEVWTTETTLDAEIDPGTEALPPNRQADRNDTGEERTRRALTVHIGDNGPGIPDEQKDAVLDKGVSELRTPGNGFGLYLVSEMVHSYGGDIDIRDNDASEDGTVVTLTFPLAE